MKRTYELRVMFSGYGHWKITTTHYGRTISTTTTNSMAVDDYKDDDERRSNRGYDALRHECIRANKNN